MNRWEHLHVWDDTTRGFVYGALLCWGIALVLLVAAPVCLRWIWVLWRQRRIEAGQYVCSSCRFDLRGATSLQCPECGKSLQGPGVTTEHHRPAFPVSLYALAYVCCGTLPLAIALYSAGIALPINYSFYKHARAVLHLEDAAQGPLAFTFNLSGRCDWRGNLIPEGVMDYALYDRSNPNTTQPGTHRPIIYGSGLGWQREEDVDAYWDQVVHHYPQLKARSDYKETAAAIRRIITHAGEGEPRDSFDPGPFESHPADPYGMYAPWRVPYFWVPSIALLIVSGAYLCRRGLKRGRQSNRAYELSIDTITQQFKEQVESNRLALQAPPTR